MLIGIHFVHINFKRLSDLKIEVLRATYVTSTVMSCRGLRWDLTSNVASSQPASISGLLKKKKKKNTG